MKCRYEMLPDHKGIKKDLVNERYLAFKYLNGKEFTKKFDSLKEAIQWRRVFHPALPDELISKKSKEDSPLKAAIMPNARMNGEDLGYYFRDVWELYKTNYLPTLEGSTHELALRKQPFVNPLMNFKMVEITATLIDRMMVQHKAAAIKPKSRRFNFDCELKALKAILNWYRLNYDPLFVNPILPRHRNAGFIRKVIKKEKKMSAEEILRFFSNLPPFWRDFAETQFYLAGRVGEVVGLQDRSIDFNEQMITIKYVMVWARSSTTVDYLKEVPKNGEERYVFINQRLSEILHRRLPLVKNGYIFHDDGNPLAYRQIQYQYNMALKKAELFPRFSSTHIMRHSMGTITRRVTGSLDAAQAVTGHKDIKMAQHYASLPTDTNKMAVNQVNAFMENLEKTVSKKTETRLHLVN